MLFTLRGEAVGRGSARAAARELARANRPCADRVTRRGSGGASPYRFAARYPFAAALPLRRAPYRFAAPYLGGE
jgi:hypothetical protein